MRIRFILSNLFSCCCILGFAQQEKANYQVIPLPQEINVQQGKPFVLNAATKIVVSAGNSVMLSDAKFLASYIKEATGKVIAISVAPSRRVLPKKATLVSNVITFSLDNTIAQNEGYSLKVDANQINIKGKDVNGIFYAIQTLRKSIPAVAKGCDIAFPSVVINDYPRFAYRGMHLDCGRHFFPAKFIKEYIDLIALHNMNYFHWHLTEDQGWRIEIKKYPKLTQIGSQRKETVIGHNSGKFDGIPYGGFYTQEEVKDIVAYAQARHITIIPEIDMPGHMLAALASYPDLGCTGGPYEVGTQWGVFNDVLCIGKENTFKFVEDVLDELIALFPSPYIHIGGDEAPRVSWKKCPLCQKRIQDEGIKGDDKHSAEDRLQSYFMARIEKYLNSKGRSIIGWDEILEGDVAPNATVMSWRGMKGGLEAAHLHHNVIMTPNTYVYFDYYQSNDIDKEPLAIGGYLPVKTVYSFEPAPSSLTPEEKKYIIGAQANVWSEYIPSTQQVEYMVLPRMAALAEVQWTEPEKKNYKEFASRLPQLMNIYQRDGLNYAKHIYDIADTCITNTQNKTLELNLSTIDNAPIYYTTDGSTPTSSSIRYTKPIVIKESCIIKAVAIRPTGMSKILSQEYNFNIATLCPITLKDVPTGKYAFNGAPALNDGLKGDSNYASGRWLGFYNQVVEATIDLGSPKEINHVSTEAIINLPAYIMGASYMSVLVSDDNVNFREVGNSDFPEETDINRIDIDSYDVSFPAETARYVKVIVKPCSGLPKGHYAEGKTAFLFLDEITVE
jgi:hexosaminidase